MMLFQTKALLLLLAVLVLSYVSVCFTFIKMWKMNMEDRTLQPAQSMVSKHIVIAHCKENLDWLDQLHTFDQSLFDPCRIHIHIYSKCGMEVDLKGTFPAVAECTTLHRLLNLGTEEYAYFQYIQDMYGNLPSIVSFVQGGGLTENPHLIYDLLGQELPGLSYKSLTRFVRNSWHMFGTEEHVEEDKTTKETEIFDHYFPYLRNQSDWLTDWRGMFSVSGSQIKNNPWSSYASINLEISRKTCASQNCNMEVLFATFFGGNPLFFHVKPNCTRRVYTNLSKQVIEEDHTKDGCRCNNTLPAMDTEWITCGSKTIIFTWSELNGALICLENDIGATFETNRLFLSNAIREDTAWTSDLSNVTWNKSPQWYSHDEILNAQTIN